MSHARACFCGFGDSANILPSGLQSFFIESCKFLNPANPDSDKKIYLISDIHEYQIFYPYMTPFGAKFFICWTLLPLHDPILGQIIDFWTLLRILNPIRGKNGDIVKRISPKICKLLSFNHYKDHFGFFHSYESMRDISR